MPYIPPPRPPPAPRPPVFRPPPGPSIHQQQMRRHQQQQQQIRHFHQTQQQLIANQNRLQMDRNRQQQQMLRQQQQQREQQEHFRRQQQLHQDNQRRQQQLHQDQLSRQQQLQQDQVRRQRQQQLLQGYQSCNSGAAGSSVFISPAFTLELAGVGLTAGGAASREDYGGPPENSYLVDHNQPSPSAPPPTSLTPQQTTPTPLGTPPTPPGPGSVYPPPYTMAPAVQSLPPQEIHKGPPLPHQINGPGGSVPQQLPQSEAGKSPRKVPSAKNEIVLKDGSCITIRNKDDYLFVGPQGHQMVVNCLPLFIPRPETLQVDPATAGICGGKAALEGEKVQKQDIHSSLHEGRQQARRGTKAARRFVLKKSSSSENLLSVGPTTPRPDPKKRSLEAEDILDENARSSVQVHRDMWTHFNPPAAADMRQVTAPVESTNTAVLSVEETVKVPLNHEVGGSWERGEGKGNVGPDEEEEEVDGGRQQGKKGDEELLSPVLSDGGSDGEDEKEMRVSYIENPDQVETLKRSSGSVSFIGGNAVRPLGRKTAAARPPSVEEDMREATNRGEPTWDMDRTDGGEQLREEEGTDGAEMGDTKIDTPGGGSQESGVRVIVESGEGGEEATIVAGWMSEMSTADYGNTSDGDELKPKIETSGMESETHNATQEPAPSDDFSSEKAALETAHCATASGPQLNSADPQDLGPNSPESQDQPLTPAVTPLPPPPVTVEPEFIERSGWLMKLSHKRGVFGDKWQKRYFVLHGSWIYYFKKYGDAIPRGAIRLHPGAWVKSVSQGTARQTDAVVKTPPNAMISVVRCIAVHRPDNFAASLSNLLSQEGVADVFRSQTISVSNSDSCSRTFYMIAPSNEERNGWVDAIHTNIMAHALSPAAMETSCRELRNMLRAIQSFTLTSELSPLLSLLHTRTRELGHRGNRKFH